MTINLPFNAIPLYNSNGSLKDDKGKNVIITSIGGPSWGNDPKTPEDIWKINIKNAKGKVIYGPVTFWFNARAKTGKLLNDKHILKEKKFTSDPYWCVEIESLHRQFIFIEKEIEFV